MFGISMSQFLSTSAYVYNKVSRMHTQCDLKTTDLFSYRIIQAWYFVSKLMFIQNRIHLTQYNVFGTINQFIHRLLPIVMIIIFGVVQVAANCWRYVSAPLHLTPLA